MNKTQLVDALAARIGDRSTAATAVDGLLDTIVDTVRNGESVSITGFGVFESRARAARTARNPRTGETVDVAAATVPAFRPGAGFRSAVNGSEAPAPRATPARRTGGAGQGTESEAPAKPARRTRAAAPAAAAEEKPASATVASEEEKAAKGATPTPKAKSDASFAAAAAPEKAGKAGKAGKAEKAGKSGKKDKADKSEKPAKAEKAKAGKAADKGAKGKKKAK